MTRANGTSGSPRFTRRESLALSGAMLAGAVAGPAAALAAGSARTGPSSGTVQVPGATIGYEDTGGAGVPIVLLHPATGSMAIWREYQLPSLSAAGLRVISYSRRGHLGSPVEPGSDPGEAVADLHALTKALGIDRFHLLGAAAGGFVVPDYALTHPERVVSMVIACSQAGCVEPSYVAALDRMLPAEFRQMPPSFRELSPSYRALNPEGTARWEALERGARLGPRVNQRAVNRLDWAGFGRIAVPTLVITGDADLYIPPALANEYARRIPKHRFETIAACGHSPHWEKPDQFNRLVIDFVRSKAR